MKIGLFPLHFWLPPVYASAAAPIVALSSALVIKAPFYVLLRLWVLVFHPLEGAFALYVLTLFGSIAIVWGALQAMKQPKLKVLIAYSTVSQVGYLFLLFPALLGADSEKVIEAIVFFVVAHSLAKVALFLCAGNFVRSNGSDFLDSYGSMLQKQPFTTIAFAMAAISLIGLPPSGGFLAKWLMLSQAFSSGNGWVIVMILIGGALGAVYLMKVMRHAFRATEKSYECAVNPIPVSMTFSAFAFALMVIMLGFFGSALHNLLQIKAMGIGGV
jgi:formate hydrogenlyase subunit 3/multisubunit Na+/H+ antiporter MnhD subunit